MESGILPGEEEECSIKDTIELHYVKSEFLHF